MWLTGLDCEVNDISRQQQEPPLIGNPRFFKRGGCQVCLSKIYGVFLLETIKMHIKNPQEIDVKLTFLYSSS